MSVFSCFIKLGTTENEERRKYLDHQKKKEKRKNDLVNLN